MRVTKYSVQLVKEKAMNYDLDNERITNPYTAMQLVNNIFNLNNQCEENLIIIGEDDTYYSISSHHKSVFSV